MKRETKFRVWDKINKKWATDFVISLDGDLLCDNGTTLFIRNNFELTQYTGVKDKNGKEIYEGNIVQGYEDREPFVIDDLMSFYYNCCEIYCGAWFNEAYENFEIIGNIYENPELRGQ